MQPRLETAMDQTDNHKGKRVKYAGRGKHHRSSTCHRMLIKTLGPTSSVATGSKTVHKEQVQKVRSEAISDCDGRLTFCCRFWTTLLPCNHSIPREMQFRTWICSVTYLLAGFLSGTVYRSAMSRASNCESLKAAQ